MKPTQEQIAAGLAASYQLRDHGNPAAGVKPISFTGDPSAHVRVIAEAVLANLPAGVLLVCNRNCDCVGECKAGLE